MLYHKSTNLDNKTLQKRKSFIPWKKELDKFRRYQPNGPPVPPACNHSCSKFECSSLDQEVMESFHKRFYYTRNRASQDAFILRHCQGRTPKRRSTVSLKKRRVTADYYIPTKERKVQVCKEAFLGILRVKKYRVDSVVKSFYMSEKSKRNVQGHMVSCSNGCGRQSKKNDLTSCTKPPPANTSVVSENSRAIGKGAFSNDPSTGFHEFSQATKKQQKSIRFTKGTGKRQTELQPIPPSVVSDKIQKGSQKTKRLKRATISNIREMKCKKEKSRPIKKIERKEEDNVENSSKLIENVQILSGMIPTLNIPHILLHAKDKRNGSGTKCENEAKILMESSPLLGVRADEETQPEDGTNFIAISISERTKEKQLRFCVSSTQQRTGQGRMNEKETLNQGNERTPLTGNSESRREVQCTGNTENVGRNIGFPDHEMFPTHLDSSDHKGSDCDWMNSKIKSRSRTFSWSPIRPRYGNSVIPLEPQEFSNGKVVLGFLNKLNLSQGESKIVASGSKVSLHQQPVQETVSTNVSSTDFGAGSEGSKTILPDFGTGAVGSETMSQDFVAGALGSETMLQDFVPGAVGYEKTLQDFVAGAVGSETMLPDFGTGVVGSETTLPDFGTGVVGSETTLQDFEAGALGSETMLPDSHTDFEGCSRVNVYESRKRRIRKLQSIVEEKENIPQGINKPKKNTDSSVLKEKSKSILVTKNKVKSSVLKKTADKFEQKARFPLQTIQYLKNQRFIYGKL